MDVVGQAESSHHCVNVIAVRQAIFESLEHKHPRPFADHQPIATVVQRSGPASRRQSSKLREPHLGIERIWERDPSAEHRVSQLGVQLVDRKLEE